MAGSDNRGYALDPLISKAVAMEQILIRNLPEGTKAALRARAARHHHSAEAEARAILTAELSDEAVPMSEPARR